MLKKTTSQREVTACRQKEPFKLNELGETYCE